MAANYAQQQHQHEHKQARTIAVDVSPDLHGILPSLEPGGGFFVESSEPGTGPLSVNCTVSPPIAHHHRQIVDSTPSSSRTSPALPNLVPVPAPSLFRTPLLSTQSPGKPHHHTSHSPSGFIATPLSATAPSPEYLIASPQPTANPFALHTAASSPSPSTASPHSILSSASQAKTHSRNTSHHLGRGFASRPHSPNATQYAFPDLAAPQNLPTTYLLHAREDNQRRTFAGFVHSPPRVFDAVASPTALGASATVISPISPYHVDESGRRHSASFPNPGPGPGYFDIAASLSPGHQRRLSVDSVVSFPSVMGVMEWQRTVTPEIQQQQLDAAFHMENFATSPIATMDLVTESNNIHNTHGREDDPSLSPMPAWNGLKTKAGKDRKRLPLACSACRRKKIRCSGQKPSCSHCLRAKQPCVYKVNTRKATPRTDYMAMLDKRLKRMEERVIRLIPKDSAAEGESEAHVKLTRAILKPSAQPGATSASKRGRKRAAGEAFGQDVEIGVDGMWRRKRNGVVDGAAFTANDADDEEEERFLHAQMTRNQLEENSLMLDGAQHLPPRDIQIHLAETYFDFVYGQSYPLLHKPTFMRNLIAGTVPPVLVLAVCAISARFSNHPRLRKLTSTNERGQLFLRGEEWAAPAREIALRRHDEPNITILTVYLLIALHEFGTCQGGRSWMFGGIAQRMALMLQLHKDKDRSRLNDQKAGEEPFSPTDREIRRRVMWSCFLMDRFISSGTDRPICFPEECISVPLPIKEKLFIMEVDTDAKMLNGESSKQRDVPKNLGTAAYIVKLVTIWGRLVTYFNLGGNRRDTAPMWDPSSSFHAILQSLATFDFPPDMRWNSENLALHKAEKLDNHFLFMHIIFQHLRLFAHRWALPGHSSTPLPADMPRRFLEASAATAIDAAEQVSNLVGEVLATGSKVTAPFAGYAAYYSSTVHVLNLFVKDAAVAEKARKTLQTNVNFLARMKKWWGMFHFVGAQLRELFKEHQKAVAAAQGNVDSTMTKENGKETKGSGIFQYGDWFDKYPSGVATRVEAHSEHGNSPTPVADLSSSSRRSETNDRGVLSGGRQEKDLLTVDEFFVRLENGESGHADSNKKARMPRSMDVSPNQIAILNQLSPRSRQQYMLNNSLAGRPPSTTSISSMGIGMGTQGPTSDPSQSLLSGAQGTFFPPSLESSPTSVDLNPLDDPWGLFQSNSSRPMAPFGSMLAHAAAEWYVPWNMHPPTSMSMSQQPSSPHLQQSMIGAQPHQGQMSQGQVPVSAGLNDMMAGIWSPIQGQGDWDGWLVP